MRGNKLFKFVDRFIGIPLLWLTSLVKARGGDLSDVRPKRILVVKFSALGDAVLLVPALDALRKKFADAEIVFLGTNLTIPFLRIFPEYIDEFVSLNIGNILRRPMTIVAMIKRLRAMEFDLAIDFEQWLRLSALLVRLSGARWRAGFRTKGQHRHRGFTHVADRDTSKHERLNFLAVVRLVTNITHDSVPAVKIDESGLVRAQGFLIKHGWQKPMAVITVHPGCGTHGFPREWEPKKYSDFVSRLGRDRSLFCVVTGTEQEQQVMDAVRRVSQVPVAVYTIQELSDYVALLSLSDLFVSSNNGAMHLAAAVGIPQVALHGPTNAVQWGPLNRRAVIVTSNCPLCPCLDLGFEYHRTDGYCMEQINVDAVYSAARSIDLTGER